MGFFTNEPTLPPNARVNNWDLDKAIDRLPNLQRQEKEYVKAMFREHWRGGQTPGSITPREFDDTLREMQRNPKDPIDSLRVSRLRELRKSLFSPQGNIAPKAPTSKK